MKDTCFTLSDTVCNEQLPDKYNEITYLDSSMLFKGEFLFHFSTLFSSRQSLSKSTRNVDFHGELQWASLRLFLLVHPESNAVSRSRRDHRHGCLEDNQQARGNAREKVSQKAEFKSTQIIAQNSNV